MFRTRFISGIVLMAITIAVVFLGGNVLFGVLLVISMIGLYELYKIVNVHRSIPGVLGYICGLSYYILLYFDLPQYQMMLFIFFLM